jgi:hypothetical protein
MDAVPWTVKAFKQRRREMWRANRVWCLLFAIGMVGFELPFYLERWRVHTTRSGLSVKQTLSTEDETEGEFTLGLVSFAVAGIGLIGVTVGVRRYYRCPKCKSMPMTFGRGLELFPDACRQCGARGGTPISLRTGWWPSQWSRDGKVLYLEIGVEENSQRHGRTAVLRLGADGLPSRSAMSVTDRMLIPHAELNLSMGADQSVYGLVKEETHRNIYCIPLHD